MLWHTIDSSSFISLGAFAYFPLSSTNLEHYPKWFDSSLYRPLKRRVARLGNPVRLNPLEDSGSMAAWCFVGKDKATPLPTHPSSDVHLHPEFPLRSSGTVPYTCPIPLVIFSINIPPSDTTTFSHYQLINFLTIRWVILPSSMSTLTQGKRILTWTLSRRWSFHWKPGRFVHLYMIRDLPIPHL